MGRPVFAYELDDPDFSWLINTFRESHPQFTYFEEHCLPLVFIADDGSADQNMPEVGESEPREPVADHRNGRAR